MSMDNSFGDAPTLGPPSKSGGHAYALHPGEVLGQYKIIKPLGAGGMGEVYEVEHQVLRRRYALKLLPATLDWKGVSLELFRREAQVMAKSRRYKQFSSGVVGGRSLTRPPEFSEGGGWIALGSFFLLVSRYIRPFKKAIRTAIHESTSIPRRPKYRLAGYRDHK